MKKFLILLSFLTVSSYADFENTVANEYAKGVNAILFFTSEDIISSGHYTFDAMDGELDSYFFPFKYSFNNDCDDYSYFINGSIGFSDFTQNHIEFRPGIVDAISLRTYALKLGGGVRVNTSEDTYMNLGAAYMYSRVAGDYKTNTLLDTSNPDDKIVDEIYNSHQNHHTFELSSSFKYQPVIHGYKPYVKLGARYFTTKIDDTYTTIPNINSSIFKLKVGVITPEITEIYGLPLHIEPYAAYIHLAGDIDDTLKTDALYVLGTIFHFGSHSFTCWVEDVASLKRDSMDWIKEVTFNMNYVKGDTLDGFNVGFGVRF